MDKETILVLKSMVKELHEMNKKLDRFGQASIFNRNSGVHIEQKAPAYIFEEDDSQKNHIL